MNKAPNPKSIEQTMHTVNAALMQTLAACDTWHQVMQWADLTLGIHRRYRALREEETGAQNQGEQRHPRPSLADEGEKEA